jgi:ZIP family zinc transporter
MNPVLAGFLAALAAGSMTGVGALPVLFRARLSGRLRDGALGFSAGVMMAASFFSLLVPSIAESTERYGAGIVPAAIAVAGLVLGAVFVAVLNRQAPHEHFITGREGPPSRSLSRVWLFVIAITIHNFPEGLAVGVGFADAGQGGLALAVGIGLQNAPEGLAVAVSLLGEGYRRQAAIGIAGVTGLVEPIGGLIGAGVVSVAAVLLPWGLAFAAGAMLYVISAEIIPETHRHGHQNAATTGLVIGLCVMMLLDVWLG